MDVIGDIIYRDSAEYKTLIHHTFDLQLAVETQLTPLGAELVAAELITRNDYASLRNTHHRNDDRAAYLIDLIQQKVQQDSRWYQTFVNVLEKDQSQYGGIVRSLQQTVTRLRQQQQSNTVDGTPPSSVAPASSLSFPSQCGREQY